MLQLIMPKVKAAVDVNELGVDFVLIVPKHCITKQFELKNIMNNCKRKKKRRKDDDRFD